MITSEINWWIGKQLRGIISSVKYWNFLNENFYYTAAIREEAETFLQLRSWDIISHSISQERIVKTIKRQSIFLIFYSSNVLW